MSQTILITGASSGLGKATAKKFASEGWNVVATMRHPEQETELTTYDHILVTKLDVTDADTIRQAVQAGIQTFGGIDVVVNNAGYGAYGPLESFTKERIARQFNTNVMGVIDVIKEIIPHFRNRRGGIIINVSSVGGKMAFPLGSLYHGTKFAVEGMSEALNYELQSFGGKVKIVEPGAIATDFTGRSLDVSNDEMITEYQPLVGKVLAATGEMFANASPASAIADVIYEAATDGTDKLRYAAGKDAEQMTAMRRQLDDSSFFNEVKNVFRL